MGIQRKTRQSLRDIMESQVGSQEPEKTAQTKLPQTKVKGPEKSSQPKLSPSSTHSTPTRMDPHRAGPSIGTVLTRQPMHRSSLLWDAPLAGEEVPGVLTCRHRDKGLFDGGLDPRIAAYITDAGLDGLLWVPHMDLDHALITALVERWRPETHSFHLPHGEMTITLQDIEVIMGVPVHGLPVVGFTHMDNWRDFCMDLLGTPPPPDRPVGTKKNTAVLEGPRIKAKWLEEQFRNPLPADATEVRVQQYARYYILQMLGSILFMDKFGERLSIMYLQFFNPISNGKNYSWGSATLSWLYRHLCKASEKTAKQIGGALLLVQLWAWAKFPQICPVMRHPHQALPPGPLAVRLSGSHIEIIWVPCPHIVRWAAHATIAEAPPFHGVMSYNDEYMAWYRPITVRHIIKETSYWDTLLRIMVKFESRSEIYTDCMNALQSVEEIIRLTLDDARTVGNASEPAVGRGWQVGGC
ncbi:serine/threonine-protein phosphatase 7 long form homolog [Castanea sativa]|uniref:serine/threonine-protein phosphatase 7 long form homolog n=1 Tax=Castanea sativa TaxID=21020 RepID=UPI003F64A91E